MGLGLCITGVYRHGANRVDHLEDSHTISTYIAIYDLHNQCMASFCHYCMTRCGPGEG